MDFPPAIPAWIAATIGAAIVLSLAVYGNLLRLIFTRGGKVSVAEFNSPDAVLGSLLVVWFTWIATRGLTGGTRPVTAPDIVHGAVLFFCIVLLIGSFLHHRGIKLVPQFGVRRIGVFRAVATGFGLLLAALPLVCGSGAIMQMVLGADAKPQEIVQFFLDASKKSERGSVIAVVVLGVILAPMAEEFIFRGYLYGVLKRYFGMLPGILCNAALFAAIHLNPTSLPALFILAVCFTIAYEVTGSILVTMSMHAMFNLTMFFALLVAARATP